MNDNTYFKKLMREIETTRMLVSPSNIQRVYEDAMVDYDDMHAIPWRSRMTMNITVSECWWFTI